MRYSTNRNHESTAMAAVPPPDTVASMAHGAASSLPPFVAPTYIFSFAGLMGSLSKVDPIAVASICLAVVTFVASQIWALTKHRRESKAAAVQLAIDELQLAELIRRRDESTRKATQ